MGDFCAEQHLLLDMVVEDQTVGLKRMRAVVGLSLAWLLERSNMPGRRLWGVILCLLVQLHFAEVFVNDFFSRRASGGLCEDGDQQRGAAGLPQGNFLRQSFSPGGTIG